MGRNNGAALYAPFFKFSAAKHGFAYRWVSAASGNYLTWLISRMASILFLVPYPQRQAPSQRFRFEQYLG
ncbi:MAG: hypothetical protein EOO60_06715, partial [Hymenobacter sp.]